MPSNWLRYISISLLDIYSKYTKLYILNKIIYILIILMCDCVYNCWFKITKLRIYLTLNHLVIRQRMRRHTKGKAGERQTGDIPTTVAIGGAEQSPAVTTQPIISPSISPSSPESEAGPSGMAVASGGDEGGPPPSPFDQPSTSKDLSKVTIFPLCFSYFITKT
jgi:hypothetical protein